MNDKTKAIKSGAVSVSYTYYEGGASFLFLFHGFGQTSEIYKSFIPAARSAYSIIAFDLFESVQNKNTSKDFISIEQWNKIIRELCEKYSIQTFSIISFSMGTRFAVSMLHQQAAHIQRMVLIAPDGFGNTLLFRIATATAVTRKIFKGIMKYPVRIKYVAKMLYTLGVLNQITFRFIERNLETESLTEKVYDTWVYVRKLGISQAAFSTLINRHEIKLLFILGKNDQLVASDVIHTLASKTHAQLIELESAHHKLTHAIDGSEVKAFLIPDRK